MEFYLGVESDISLGCESLSPRATRQTEVWMEALCFVGICLRSKHINRNRSAQKNFIRLTAAICIQHYRRYFIILYWRAFMLFISPFVCCCDFGIVVELVCLTFHVLVCAVCCACIRVHCLSIRYVLTFLWRILLDVRCFCLDNDQYFVHPICAFV